MYPFWPLDVEPSISSLDIPVMLWWWWCKENLILNSKYYSLSIKQISREYPIKIDYWNKITDGSSDCGKTQLHIMWPHWQRHLRYYQATCENNCKLVIQILRLLWLTLCLSFTDPQKTGILYPEEHFLKSINWVIKC